MDKQRRCLKIKFMTLDCKSKTSKKQLIDLPGGEQRNRIRFLHIEENTCEKTTAMLQTENKICQIYYPANTGLVHFRSLLANEKKNEWKAYNNKPTNIYTNTLTLKYTVGPN